MISSLNLKLFVNKFKISQKDFPSHPKTENKIQKSPHDEGKVFPYFIFFFASSTWQFCFKREVGFTTRQLSIPPCTSSHSCCHGHEILEVEEYYLQKFDVNLLRKKILQQQECELAIAAPIGIKQEIIQPSADFNPVGFAIVPSKELPAESFTTIQPTTNISSLPSSHTPAYTQPLKHLASTHTDVNRPVIKAITPV